MKRLPLLVGLVLAMVACGSPTAVGRRMAPPTVPVSSVPSFPRPSFAAAAPSANATCGFRAVGSSGPPPAAAASPGQIEVLALVYTNGVETVHLLTLQGSAVTDKVLIDGADALVMDAGHGIALVATAKATQLSTLDLNSGALRTIAASDGCDIGPAVLSPDGSHAAVATRNADNSYEIVIVDLGSGVARPLLRTGIDEYNRAGLVPLEWLASGILVSPGVWDGPTHGLLRLDPSTAALTPLTVAQVDRLSPDGNRIAASSHIELGDSPYPGPGQWPNQLTTGPVAGTTTVVANQKNRAFSTLDLADDGTLLYVNDDAPGSTTPPAPDMGLYLYSGGSSVQQLGEGRVGEMSAALGLGDNRALVARTADQGYPGIVEIDLVTLCHTTGCRAAGKMVLVLHGPYPIPALVLVKA